MWININENLILTQLQSPSLPNIDICDLHCEIPNTHLFIIDLSFLVRNAFRHRLLLCSMPYCNPLVLLFFLPGLYNFLPPDSREFEDLVKTVSSCYLDSSSRGTFTYCKARLIRNELLEKEVGCQIYASVFFFFF